MSVKVSRLPAGLDDRFWPGLWRILFGAWLKDASEVRLSVQGGRLMSPPKSPSQTIPDDVAGVILSGTNRTVLIRSGAKALAASLGVSRRTLVRFLAARGCTLRRLRKQLRFEAALRMLGEGRSMNSVTHALGFASQQSLRRFLTRERRDSLDLAPHAKATLAQKDS
jgi:AraC-like DNA-binding protein